MVLGALSAPVAGELEPWQAFGPDPAPADEGPVRVMAIPEDVRLERPRSTPEPGGLLPGALVGLWGLRRRGRRAETRGAALHPMRQ